MSKLKVFAGFIPWIVFSLFATRSGEAAVAVAGLLAFLVAVVFVLQDLRRGRAPKILDVTAAIAFAAIAIVSLVDPAANDFLASYGRSLATWTLVVVIFALLPVMPFTEQYARESSPSEYWHTPLFRSINRRISAVWGIAIALMAAGHLLASLLVSVMGADAPREPIDLFFNWVVPIAAVWWAVHYTIQHSKGPHEAPPADAGAHADGGSHRTA